MDMKLTSPSPSMRSTGMVGSQNSPMNCLHIPHGLAGSPDGVLVATARALIVPYLAPAATAVPNAHRSAHVPTGKEAFSTLTPV